MSQVDERKTGDKEARTGGFESDLTRVTFMPEQQAKVQELIDEAYRKAYAKAQKTRGSSEEVERLKDEVERLRQDRKTAAILKAISRHNVVDADEIAELVKDRVRMDEDGHMSVLGDSGAVKIDGNGRAMGLDEFVGHWLRERPHHIRSAGGHGAGSQSALFKAGAGAGYDLSDPSAWREMPREDLDRLLRKGVDVRGGAGTVYKFKDVKNPFIEARRRKAHGADR